MTDDLDFYDLLRVDEEASEEEIREGFRQQVREYHPDLNDDPRAPAQFSALKKAYDTLADPKERDAYDRMGHDEYVSNRISGLPSPDAWMVDDGGDDEEDDPGTDDGDSGTSTHTGRTTTSASTSSRSSSRRSTTETASETTGTSNSTTDVSGSSSTAETAQESTRTTRSRSRQTSASSTETSEQPRREPNESSVDPSTGGGHAGTGAGTARGPGMGTAPSDDAEPADSDETSPADSESSSSGRSLVSGLEDAFTSAIGWPLILTADVLFLVSLGLYAAANAEGLNVLVDRLAAAGADPGALQSALETRPQGLDSLASFLGTKLNASPVVGMVALVGMAFLPSVYFFMVRWTRRNRLPWQPSYLYVVGSLSPIAALVASGLADLPGAYVEVVGFFLVPVVTIVSMLFFAQIKPRIARLYRRWRYRIGS